MAEGLIEKPTEVEVEARYKEWQCAERLLRKRCGQYASGVTSVYPHHIAEATRIHDHALSLYMAVKEPDDLPF